MKIAPLITAALVLCITLPLHNAAKKKPKPSTKYCDGIDGNRYQIGQGYLDTETCIRYTCKRVKKRATMIEEKLPKPCTESPASSPSPLVTTISATTESHENLVLKVTELEDAVQSIIDALDTKCDQTTCSSNQASTTDIETCLSDVSSSDCPSSPSGKIGLAVALAGASTCDTSEAIDKCHTVSLNNMDSNFCPGHMCPTGCCPVESWYCCPNSPYCAIDPQLCPQDTADHSKDLPPWCYYHPGCNSGRYCNFGYHCINGNYCCQDRDYGDITLLTEQDALNYSLAYAGPDKDSIFLAGFKRRTADENTIMELSCEDGYDLYIKSAEYTDVGNSICKPHPNADFNVVYSLCQSAQQCSITVDNTVFYPDPCHGHPKTLTVWYTCTGSDSLDIQEFQDFENNAVQNFENEIATSCSLSHGNCGIIWWARCLKYGYKDYHECKTICKGEYKCITACVIKKLDTHPKCKGCIKALMKAICCYFIPKSPCCDMTNEDFEAFYNISAATAPVCNTVSEFEIMVAICQSGTINVTSALYGRPGVHPCQGQSALTSEEIVKSYCQGHEGCQVPATNAVFGQVNCGFQNPVLKVCYTCDN